MVTQRPGIAPLVSLVLPIRNEAEHLDRALDAIDSQTYPPDRIEIIAVDGGSIDGTQDILRDRSASDHRIRTLGGPGVNTPLAMNIGAAASSAEILIKVDGHGWMNDRFVEVAITALQADPGLGCVGGLIEPIATTPVEQAIAVTRFSRFGVGGGVYTLVPQVQDTDTVQCGAYRRRALTEAGGFDPSIPYGEDEELNYRIRRAGWRIQLQPGMRFTYRVRPSLAALFRQYFRYGRARVAVVRKHPGFFRPKHAAPAALVSVLALSLALVPVPGWQLATLAAWVGYLAFVGTGSISLAASNRFTRLDLLGASLMTLHMGYGLGSLRGLFDRHPASMEGGPQSFEGASGFGPQGERVADEAQPQQHEA